ncbi:ketoacyl-ACP synthase III family protein [Solwaraspora sp. WMMD1047]|uniref:ketoacyl-ACP synthase III family protein n=1 Tax=Solwaraspora sp. WMMD1047 TaxID=3016102 RepID=UPI0024162A19|nr:ketoacyl-ACP synthase III family protein [Solwaraspora sp. WMMD1047]MDG4827787.1 ketoacyl-ACP synthase III family protein [Solwaraspora sp. WMMD1047]
MEIFIGGVGSVVPPLVSIETAIEQGLCPPDKAELHELGGAAVAGDRPAPELALAAAQDALKRHGSGGDNLGLLLYVDVWHQGPDGWLPHYYLQRHLTGGEVLALEVRQGCNGMFNALELAAGYLRGDPRRRDILIVAAENFGTPLIDRWRTGPNLIMGDGASALVLTAQPSFAQLMAVESVTIAAGEELHRRGEEFFPPGVTTGRQVDFAARTDAFVELTMADEELWAIWAMINQQLVEVVERACATAGIGIDDITRVAFTNLGRESVEERCMGALGIPMSRSTWTHGRDIGHVGASDQVIALDHLLATGELRPGDHLLMAGVGPGVTVSCALVRITDTPPWTS